MKKRYLLLPAFLALFFTFLFGVSAKAELNRIPTEIGQNDIFWYSFNEDVSYNAYKTTYYYYDGLNKKGYSKYEFKLLGEDYKGKTVSVSNLPISEFNNDLYLSDFAKTSSNKSFYYLEVTLINRSYTYLGVKKDVEVDILKSDKIDVISDIEAPILVYPANNVSFSTILVNFEVESEIDYQVYVAKENGGGSKENWQILNSCSFKGEDNTTYYWKAVDALGQESEERKFSINVPSELPTFNINGYVSTWNNKDVNIEITASNKGTSYYCLNENCQVVSSQKNVVIFEDGIYEFYVKNVNNGTTLSSEKYTLKIDKTSPEFSEDDFNFKYDLVDNIYQYELEIGNVSDYSGIKAGKISIMQGNNNVKSVDYEGTSLNIDLSNLLNEKTTYTMKITLEDNAGNKMEKTFSLKTLSNPIVIVVKAPSISINGKTGEYTNENVSVTITPVDTSYQNYYCLNDNCSLINGTKSYTYNSTGIYRIYTKALSENESVNSKEYTIMIDKEAPSVSYNFNENNGNYTLSVTAADNIDVANVKVIVKKGNDNVYQINKSEKSFNLTLTNYLELETTYSIEITVTDKAGNQTSKSSSIQTSLREIPVIPLYLGDKDLSKYYRSFRVMIKDYSYSSEYEDYYCENGKCERLSTDSDQNFFYSKSGEYNIYTKRVKGDRVVTSSTYTIKIDTEINQIDSSVVSLDREKINGSYHYILNCLNIEDLSGIDKINVFMYKVESSGNKIKVLNEDYTTIPLSVDFTSYLENNYKYEITVKYYDNASNESTYTFDKYIISEPVLPTVSYRYKNSFVTDGEVIDNIHFYNGEIEANIVLDENSKDLMETYYCFDAVCTRVMSSTLVGISKEGLHNFKVKNIYEGKETIIDERKIFIDSSAPVYKNFSYSKSPEETTTNIYAYSIDITGISDSLDAYGMKKYITLTIKDAQGNSVFTSYDYGSDNFKDSYHVTENKLEEGDYTVEIHLQDALYNVHTYYENIHIEKLELSAPIITTNTPYSTSLTEWYTKDDIVVTFKAVTESTKDIKNSYCARNGSNNCTWIDFEGEVSITIGEGYTNISARVSYGNYNTYGINSGFFAVDSVAPVINSMDTGYGGKWLSFYVNPSVAFDCVEETSGVDQFYVKNDKLYPEWTGFKPSIMLGRYLDSGIYHFQSYAVDKAGNKSDIFEFDIMIDGRHPYTDDINSIYEFSSSNGKNQITIKNLYDDESGIEKITVRVYDKTSKNLVNTYSLTENVTIPCTIDISSLAEGEYYLLIEASDFVGNTAQSNEIYFNIGGENSTFEYQENRNIYLSEIAKNTKKVNNSIPFVIAMISLLFVYLIINKTKIIKKF